MPQDGRLIPIDRLTGDELSSELNDDDNVDLHSSVRGRHAGQEAFHLLGVSEAYVPSRTDLPIRAAERPAGPTLRGPACSAASLLDSSHRTARPNDGWAARSLSAERHVGAVSATNGNP